MPVLDPTQQLGIPPPTGATNPDPNKMTMLQNLAQQLPVANQQIAAGQQAARQMQLQQAVATRGTPANTAAAQQMGTQLGQQAGQQAVQNAQQGVQQLGQVGQLGGQQRALQNQAQVASLESGARQQEMDNVQKLANISEQAKQELYDKQIQFQKDELGRTQLNTIQLADWARTSAQNEQVYKSYAQQADQISQRNIQVMQAAYARVTQDLDNKYQAAKQQADEKTMTEIAKQKQDLTNQMYKTKARAANNAAAWTAGGTVIGGAVGAAGGPIGAIAGASVGAAVGGIGASLQPTPGPNSIPQE